MKLKQSGYSDSVLNLLQLFSSLQFNGCIKKDKARLAAITTHLFTQL